MAQTKHEIQALLARAGTEPRYRFGQNFMIDQNLVRLVADAGELSAGDVAFEVGPGTGTLTEELLARAGGVVAVEIDRDLAALLRQRFADRPGFTLIEGDALAGKHELNPALLAAVRSARDQGRPVKLVANLPYNIASPLVIESLIAGASLLAFTVQKEVAMRLRAAAGSDDYGPLSVMAQMLSRVEVLRTLPPQAFWPAPKIESSLVRLVREDRLGDRAAAFGRFVQGVFSFRRKTLRKGLSQAGYDAGAALAAAGLDGQSRPEVLTPEQLLRLWEVVRAPARGGRCPPNPATPPPSNLRRLRRREPTRSVTPGSDRVMAFTPAKPFRAPARTPLAGVNHASTSRPVGVSRLTIDGSRPPPASRRATSPADSIIDTPWSRPNSGPAVKPCRRSPSIFGVRYAVWTTAPTAARARSANSAVFSRGAPGSSRQRKTMTSPDPATNNWYRSKYRKIGEAASPRGGGRTPRRGRTARRTARSARPATGTTPPSRARKPDAA